MVICKVFSDVKELQNAHLAAPPHAGEYIWYSGTEGGRIYYRVESVVHSLSGEVELVVKEAARPQFHKGQ